MVVSKYYVFFVLFLGFFCGFFLPFVLFCSYWLWDLKGKGIKGDLHIFDQIKWAHSVGPKSNEKYFEGEWI